MTPTRRDVTIAAAALACGCALGAGMRQYRAPAGTEQQASTKTEERIVYRDRVAERVTAGPTRTVTRTIERLVPCPSTPEGPSAPVLVRETVATTESGPIVSTVTSEALGASTATGTSSSTSVTTYEQPRLLVQAGALVDLSHPLGKPGWSLGAAYRVAGPVWLGAAYHSDHSIEPRLSFTF